jgi:hypothetical protein
VLTHYCPRRSAGSEQGPINLGALQMTTSSSIKHVYDPETLSIMTDAFDRACDNVRGELSPHVITVSKLDRKKMAVLSLPASQSVSPSAAAARKLKFQQ